MFLFLLSLPDDELNSQMFQTVGHEAITDLAVSLNVPLFRVELKRPSTMTDMDYKKDMDDEVEDLFNLVQAMKEGVAGGIDAVCSGAILSDYQRIRVEHV